MDSAEPIAAARHELRLAARHLDEALAIIANMADHQPVSFTVGDRIAEARQKTGDALYALT